MRAAGCRAHGGRPRRAALALLWGWRCFAVCVLAGFAGLLRPSEWLAATRGSLLLPRDLLDDDGAAYWGVLAPKTRRKYKRQHVKIDQAALVDLLDAMFGAAAPDTPLCGLSAVQFRRRWDAVFAALNFETDILARRLTPSCLRGSGATALYRATGDVKLVQWRGRWARLETVEAYIQEVACSTALIAVPPQSRHTITQLSAALPLLLSGAAQLHRKIGPVSL